MKCSKSILSCATIIIIGPFLGCSIWWVL